MQRARESIKQHKMLMMAKAGRKKKKEKKIDGQIFVLYQRNFHYTIFRCDAAEIDASEKSFFLPFHRILNDSTLA